MKEKTDNTNQHLLNPENGTEINFPAFPLYPVDDDIYNKSKQEENTDPEDISKLKAANQSDKAVKDNEKKFSEDVSGNDLDIPGSELDDEEEIIGSEDEENNSYSLGGDNHNDLEEDKG